MTISFKTFVLVVAAVLGLGAVCPACDRGDTAPASDSTGTSAVASADLATVEYGVAGMTCGGCALAARTAVARLDGVAEVEASYEGSAGYARVTYDPTRVDPARIAAAIEELGYAPTLR